jgi:hypothetical protein
VAICSMQEALVADGQQIPGGSSDFDRQPMRVGRASEPASDPASSVAAVPTPTTPTPTTTVTTGEPPTQA